MADFTPQIAAGAAVTLLGLVITAMFRLLRLQRLRDEDYERQLDEERADRNWCAQHRAVLINLCLRGNLTVPDIVWTDRPPLVAKGKRRRDPG